MSNMFNDHHRAFQDQFDTRRIADKIEGVFVQPEVSEGDQAFIESRDMFWLTTIDGHGRPTVSYKGGDPGFVKVVDTKTIAFPIYDGNGMFYSVGNIMTNSKIGMLFLSFEKPFRVRVQGEASISQDEALMSQFHEAQMVVKVTVSEVWPNCPRYVHRYDKVKASKYVPRADVETPFAGWKRIDFLQEDLASYDQGVADRVGGQITVEDWFGLALTGNPDA